MWVEDYWCCNAVSTTRAACVYKVAYVRVLPKEDNSILIAWHQQNRFFWMAYMDKLISNLRTFSTQNIRDVFISLSWQRMGKKLAWVNFYVNSMANGLLDDDLMENHQWCRRIQVISTLPQTIPEIACDLKTDNCCRINIQLSLYKQTTNGSLCGNIRVDFNLKCVLFSWCLICIYPSCFFVLLLSLSHSLPPHHLSLSSSLSRSFSLFVSIKATHFKW